MNELIKRVFVCFFISHCPIIIVTIVYILPTRNVTKIMGQSNLEKKKVKFLTHKAIKYFFYLPFYT